MDPGDRLVAAQIGALAGLAWPGPRRWRLAGWARVGAAAATVGGALASATAAAQHGTHLSPRVAPPAEAALLQQGPYRWSRHPVYAGLLLAAAGVAALRARPEPVLAAAVLGVVLHLKSDAEERALRERFGPAYVVYAARTPRLLGVPRTRSGCGQATRAR